MSWMGTFRFYPWIDSWTFPGKTCPVSWTEQGDEGKTGDIQVKCGVHSNVPMFLGCDICALATYDVNIGGTYVRDTRGRCIIFATSL